MIREKYTVDQIYSSINSIFKDRAQRHKAGHDVLSLTKKDISNRMTAVDRNLKGATNVRVPLGIGG